MTNTPIRAIVFTVCEPIPDDELTLRRLVEWSKNVVANVGSNPSPQELKYIQQAWGAMIEKKAGAEAVPHGWLSYSLQELQVSEEQILEQAMADVSDI